MSRRRIYPEQVREVVSRHMLVDGFRQVVDLDKSHGAWMVDEVTGQEYLDFYTFFASSPLGFNHPRLRTKEFGERLVRAAVHKPANSDCLTVEMAEFVDTCSRIAIPEKLPHLFIVEGGALAVENAMKAAFDWKVRKNLERGVEGKGGQIIHFREAFHGRSGYTLSVTNTDPVKTAHFPKFSWPRILNPYIRFPATKDALADTREREERALLQVREAFEENPDDIAAILIEPIQCEGGDHHFRAEFLQALRGIADEKEALLIFDEVQTGVGTTGKMWAFEHFGLVPDIVAFGKKLQVGGILCSRRIEEVADHVFSLSSRINSTWGGGLVDLVRATEILEVIRDEGLVENAARRGEELIDGLAELAADHPEFLTGVRGRGLLAAFDLPSKEFREEVRAACLEKHLIVLSCGPRSIRLRPALNVSQGEIREGIRRLHKALHRVAALAG